jgi:hypothetical protein
LTNRGGQTRRRSPETNADVEAKLATRSYELNPAYDREATRIERDIKATAPKLEACTRTRIDEAYNL